MRHISFTRSTPHPPLSFVNTPLLILLPGHKYIYTLRGIQIWLPKIIQLQYLNRNIFAKKSFYKDMTVNQWWLDARWGMLQYMHFFFIPVNSFTNHLYVYENTWLIFFRQVYYSKEKSLQLTKILYPKLHQPGERRNAFRSYHSWKFSQSDILKQASYPY